MFFVYFSNAQNINKQNTARSFLYQLDTPLEVDNSWEVALKSIKFNTKLIGFLEIGCNLVSDISYIGDNEEETKKNFILEIIDIPGSQVYNSNPLFFHSINQPYVKQIYISVKGLEKTKNLKSVNVCLVFKRKSETI